MQAGKSSRVTRGKRTPLSIYFVSGSGILGVAGVAVGVAANLGQLLTLPFDILLIALALVMLTVTGVALFQLAKPDRRLLGAGLAVIMLATAMTTIGVDRIVHPAKTQRPATTTALPPWKKQGGPAQLLIPLGTGDNLPQGSFALNPVRLGPDPYKGDVSVGCETEGKKDSVQNCTGRDERLWTLAPIGGHALIGTAIGDAFADAGACEEKTGVTYQSDYVPTEAGKTFCLRERGDTNHLTALRIVSYPTAQPLPTELTIETMVWSRAS